MVEIAANVVRPGMSENIEPPSQTPPEVGSTVVKRSYFAKTEGPLFPLDFREKG